MKLWGTSRKIGCGNDIQTVVTMNPRAKTIELRAAESFMTTSQIQSFGYLVGFVVKSRDWKSFRS